MGLDRGGVASELAHPAKPTKRLIGEDLAGAFDGKFGGTACDAPHLPCDATQIGRLRCLLSVDANNPDWQIILRGKCKSLTDHQTRMRKRAKRSSR